jgi:putative DNA primase/helicase
MRPDLRLVDPMDEEEPPYDGGADDAADDNRYFTALGHDRGLYYVFTHQGGQVLDFAARDLVSHGALFQLAPLLYWEMHYASKTADFNARAAGNDIMQRCFRAGIYDGNRVRGRGAWLDDGRVVLHLGERLIVDGVPTEIKDFKTIYVYERGRLIHVELMPPLTSREAHRLIELCMGAPWEDPEGMGKLLAGWLVIAPVCGAMPWRPHIWITSESGGGKTWIQDNIIRPIIAELAVRAQSKTTEAGLRGELGIDARPVLFDEFESQNEQDRSRIQLVLDLARQASSEDGADILKGTQTGGVRRYRIRSCFLYSSINLGMGQAADESRTVVLPLAPPVDPAERVRQFERLQALHAEIMRPGFAAALLARTLKLLPTIRANCEVFAQAIARSGSSRRTGDTIGVLLAGAWSLRSSKPATPAEADAFLANTTWTKAAVERSDSAPEWQRAIGFLVQQRIRYVGSNSRPEEVPIGDMIIGIVQPSSNEAAGISVTDARRALTRAGIIVRDRDKDGFPLPRPTLVIASSSDQLRTFFEKSPWASGWAATLKRTPGSSNLDNKTVAFGALKCKAIELPLEVVV